MMELLYIVGWSMSWYGYIRTLKISTNAEHMNNLQPSNVACTWVYTWENMEWSKQYHFQQPKETIQMFIINRVDSQWSNHTVKRYIARKAKTSITCNGIGESDNIMLSERSQA